MKQRIYIAEDDGGIRELIRCTLESFGFDAFEFPDGEALLNQIQREGTIPDLVLSSTRITLCSCAVNNQKRILED